MRIKDRSGSDPHTRICNRCKQSLPVTEYGLDSRRHDKLTAWCLSCRRVAAKKWREEHPEEAKARFQRWKEANSEWHAEYNRKRNRKERADVLNEYGGQCACCGERRFEFLSIDHINGGGNQHRKTLAKGGAPFMRWLKEAGYPKAGFRILCHNCNASHGHYGYCPHKNPELSQFSGLDNT